MSKNTVNKDEAQSDDKRLSRLEALVRIMCKEIKEHFGIDVENKSGKAMLPMFALMLIASLAFAGTDTVVDWGVSSMGTIGTAKITTDGTYCTFAVDKISGATITGSTFNAATLNTPTVVTPTITNATMRGTTTYASGGVITGATINAATVVTPTITNATMRGTTTYEAGGIITGATINVASIVSPAISGSPTMNGSAPKTGDFTIITGTGTNFVLYITNGMIMATSP
jgi:hypothetical protein